MSVFPELFFSHDSTQQQFQSDNKRGAILLQTLLLKFGVVQSQFTLRYQSYSKRRLFNADEGFFNHSMS